MCGIFGGIGRNVNPAIIRALAIANKARGKDSLGFFDSSGKCVKAQGTLSRSWRRRNSGNSLTGGNHGLLRGIPARQHAARLSTKTRTHSATVATLGRITAWSARRRGLPSIHSTLSIG